MTLVTQEMDTESTASPHATGMNDLSISAPFNFRHLYHVEVDPAGGFTGFPAHWIEGPAALGEDKPRYGNK